MVLIDLAAHKIELKSIYVLKCASGQSSATKCTTKTYYGISEDLSQFFVNRNEGKKG